MRCWCGGEIATIGGKPACMASKFHDPTADGRPAEVTRLYLAGPMSGYADCNYPLFNRVADKLRGAGWSVANPAEVHLSGQYHYTDLIREDLWAMLDCHGVALLDRWWESAGARNEASVAGMLKMPVRPWQEWMSITPGRKP